MNRIGRRTINSQRPAAELLILLPLSAAWRTWADLPSARPGRECRVGPGNFTPSRSQIPDVNLSIHTARAIA